MTRNRISLGRDPYLMIEGVKYPIAKTSSAGVFTGDVVGDLTGDVTGDLTGDVTGDLTGDVTGDLTGNVLAVDGTTVLDAGSDGSDATFIGNILATKITKEHLTNYLKHSYRIYKP